MIYLNLILIPAAAMLLATATNSWNAAASLVVLALNFVVVATALHNGEQNG